MAVAVVVKEAFLTWFEPAFTLGATVSLVAVVEAVEEVFPAVSDKVIFKVKVPSGNEETFNPETEKLPLPLTVVVPDKEEPSLDKVQLTVDPASPVPEKETLV